MVEVDKRLLAPEARRPLSPHLQIYTPDADDDDVHRASHHRDGAVRRHAAARLVPHRAGGRPAAFATRPPSSAPPSGCSSWSCFTWAMIHHLLGGVRHLFWDMGYGMDYPGREYLAQGTLVGGLLLTALVWVAAYAFADREHRRGKKRPWPTIRFPCAPRQARSATSARRAPAAVRRARCTSPPSR